MVGATGTHQEQLVRLLAHRTPNKNVMVEAIFLTTAHVETTSADMVQLLPVTQMPTISDFYRT
jgi:hypothetical protein